MESSTPAEKDFNEPSSQKTANAKELSASSSDALNEKDGASVTPSRRSSTQAADLVNIKTASVTETAIDSAPVEQSITQQRRDAEAAVDYPTGLKLAVILIGLELAVLCVALDNTIIATAIPRITDEFHALADVGWYGSAYLLTISAFQLFFGRLYSIFSIKWTFLGALFVFELGSLICAVAPSSTALIVGRAIAGLGSAGLFSGVSKSVV